MTNNDKPPVGEIIYRRPLFDKEPEAKPLKSKELLEAMQIVVSGMTAVYSEFEQLERQLHEARALLEGVGNANPLGTAGEEAEVGVICHYCQVFMLYAEEKGFNSILRDKAKEEGKHHYERAYDASEYIKEEFPHSLGCAWVKIRAFLKQ